MDDILGNAQIAIRTQCSILQKNRSLVIDIQGFFINSPTRFTFGGSMDPGNRLTRIRNSKFRAWVWYQVVIPAFAVAVCWPIARWFYNVQFAFEKNFVSGDLLLLGALLFIGISVEIHAEVKATTEFDTADPEDRLDKLYQLSQFLAFIFGAAFWVVKLKSINYDFPTTSKIDLPTEIYLSIGASIIGGILAIVWAYAAFKKAYRIFLAAEIRELTAATVQPRGS